MAPLQTKSDKEFHERMNEGMGKLAGLHVAYTDLLGCVRDYTNQTR